MSGIKPYWIIGEVKILIEHAYEAHVKVSNGNVYLITPNTPGINFTELKIGTFVELEITDRLNRVYSARIISDAAGEDGNPLVS